MYCASFIWEAGTYDAEFDRLNTIIDDVAKAMPGYLGSEFWKSANSARECANYYWTDLDTLKAFSNDPTHLKAIKQYASWYMGYHVVISEVIKSYGDGAFQHITPNERARKSP